MSTCTILIIITLNSQLSILNSQSSKPIITLNSKFSTFNLL